MELIQSEIGENTGGSGLSFTVESHASVAVMVAKIITESFPANLEAQVSVTGWIDNSLRQRLKPWS